MTEEELNELKELAEIMIAEHTKAGDALYRLLDEYGRLRDIEEAAKEFSAAKHAMDAHIPSDKNRAQLHWRQYDAQKHLDELLGEGVRR